MPGAPKNPCQPGPRHRLALALSGQGGTLVLAALQSNAEYAGQRRHHGEKEARAADLGQAVCYRFKRDAKLDFTQNLEK